MLKPLLKLRKWAWRKPLNFPRSNWMTELRVWVKLLWMKKRLVSSGSSAMRKSRRITLIPTLAYFKPGLSLKIRYSPSRTVRSSSTHPIVRFKSYKNKTWSSSTKSMRLLPEQKTWIESWIRKKRSLSRWKWPKKSTFKGLRKSSIPLNYAISTCFKKILWSAKISDQELPKIWSVLERLNRRSLSSTKRSKNWNG